MSESAETFMIGQFKLNQMIARDLNEHAELIDDLSVVVERLARRVEVLESGF